MCVRIVFRGLSLMILQPFFLLRCVLCELKLFLKFYKNYEILTTYSGKKVPNTWVFFSCFCCLKKIYISIRDFDYNAEETINASILNFVYFVWPHRLNSSCTKLQQPAPSCTLLHQSRPIRTNLHQLAPKCTNLHQVAPNCCTKVQQTALSCTNLHQSAPNWTNLHQTPPTCTNLHQCEPSCINFYQVAPHCSKFY